jgi:hypothetical protein
MARDSLVVIHKPDGSTTFRFPYSKHKLREVQNGKRPKNPRPPQKRTAADLYPRHDKHAAEWRQVQRAARPIIWGRIRAHEGGFVTAHELEPFAVDGALRAFLQWRDENPGPSIVEEEVNGKIRRRLDKELRKRIATEVDKDVRDGVKRLQRGTRPKRGKNRMFLGEGEGDVEATAGAKEDPYPWLDRFLDWSEMKAFSNTIPDPIDGPLYQMAYAVVHHRSEMKELTGTPVPADIPVFTAKRELWMLEWFLIWFFSARDFHPVCPLEVFPRLKRAQRWIDHQRIHQATGAGLPRLDGGGRSWRGRPRGIPECAVCDDRSRALRADIQKSSVIRQKVAEQGSESLSAGE